MSVSTIQFRRQHEALTRSAGELLRALRDVDAVRQKPMDARRLLAAFVGQLEVHGAMEEQALYPVLRAHDDPAVRDVAERLWASYGGLYATVTAVPHDWDNAAIAKDAAGFIATVKGMVVLLGERMQREDRELYALVDEICANTAR
jgi:hypothetical protein